MTGTQKLLRILALPAIALLLHACAPVLTSVVVRTDPAGGQVAVSDQQVTDGNTVELLPGSWDFVSSLHGYRDGHVTAEVAAEPDNVTVPLGLPFGRLAVLVSPADAAISLDSEMPKRGPERHYEMDPGPHDITFTHPDYPRVSRHVEIVTGGEVSVQVAMADTAPLTITTDDKLAVVYVDGARVGQGVKHTVGVARGTHNVAVVHTHNGWQRRYAKRTVAIEHESGADITLRPQAEQWLFEGRWLAASDAHRREQQRFSRQTIADTALTRVTLGPQAESSLRESGVLTTVLHAVMRVGDQVVLTGTDHEWIFTKRNAAVGAAFKALGAAFKRSQGLDLPWTAPEPLYELTAQVTRQASVTLASAVIRTRLALPLTLLAGDELAGDGLTVSRVAPDGPVTVVVSGGEDIEVDGKRVTSKGTENVYQLAAAGSSVSISWSSKPAAITVIATRKLNRLDWRSWESLLRGDKRLGAVFADGQVQRIERVSGGPEYPETTSEVFAATGPLAAEMNLHMIDLGPHDVAGNYYRSWRFLLSADGTTQRQLDLRYQVSTESLATDTRNFLRHEADSKN